MLMKMLYRFIYVLIPVTLNDNLFSLFYGVILSPFSFSTRFLTVSNRFVSPSPFPSLVFYIVRDL